MLGGDPADDLVAMPTLDTQGCSWSYGAIPGFHELNDNENDVNV